MKKLKNKIFAAIKFVSFSIKQLKILTWWTSASPYHQWNGIIADGAIRAGKTVPMAMSFVFWAMDTFNGQNFALCGKSIGAFKRNVWQWLKPVLIARGYSVVEVRSTNFITITYRGKANYFYIFGGKDESSQDLIQGITLAGIYFDEVALQPESFVLQGTGRCSVEGSKFWFNCNPEGPEHWFKKDWIDQAAEKRLLHLHFSMDDNPSLSDETKARYKSMYSGVFFQRFIIGLWVIAKGAIYDMFGDNNKYLDGTGPNYDLWHQRYFVIDYGTVNPFVILEIVEQNKKYYVENEWYYDSRQHNRQKDDNEHTEDLIRFINKRRYSSAIVDPSAASFKAAARSKGIKFRDADNEVLDGIRLTSSLFSLGLLKINKDKCPMLIAEIASYVWDEKASERGEEKPVKVFDHAVDALRYFVKTIVRFIPGVK